MEPIGTHGLACLNDTDWADYARYMQCQAEAIDAALFEQQTALEAVLSRPTIVVRPTGAANTTIASGVTVSNYFNEVVYVNNTFMTLSTVGSVTYINIGSPVGSALNPYEPGMYLVGGSIGMDATGAVTAFSQRNLTLNAIDDTLQPPNQQIALAYDINPDANTAITNISVSASFSMVLRGTNGVKVSHTISHTNAASTVSILGADARLWVTYLGPNELVEVS